MAAKRDLKSHWLIKNLKSHGGNHYYAVGNSIYLGFLGDGIYQFEITSNKGKEYAEQAARAIATALNIVGDAKP